MVPPYQQYRGQLWDIKHRYAWAYIPDTEMSPLALVSPSYDGMEEWAVLVLSDSRIG